MTSNQIEESFYDLRQEAKSAGFIITAEANSAAISQQLSSLLLTYALLRVAEAIEKVSVKPVTG
jgi:hypothetical protein